MKTTGLPPSSTSVIEAAKPFFFLALSVSILSYGYEIFNYSLTLDEDTAGLRTAYEMLTYVRQGRWGSYLLNILVQPSSVMPYFPTALAVLLLSAAAALLAVTEQLPRAAALSLCAIAASSPVNSFWLQFNNASPYYALGILLTCQSYALCRPSIQSPHCRIQLPRIALSGLCLGLAISTYQAQVPVFLTLSAALLFRMTCLGAATLKQLAHVLLTLALSFALGLIVYTLGDSISRILILDHDQRPVHPRILSFIQWGSGSSVLRAWESLRANLEMLLGISPSLRYWGATLTAVPLSLLAFASLVKRPPYRMAAAFLSLMVIVIAPASTIWVSGNGEIPVRSMVALPIAAALLWSLAILASPPYIRKMLVCAVFLVVLNSAYTNARIFKTAHLSASMDSLLALRITERVLEEAPISKSGVVKVAFVGQHQHPQNENFFNFARPISQSSLRYTKYLKKLRSFFIVSGFPEIDPVSPAELGEFQSEAASLPRWPARGSVKLLGDIVAIRLN